ncbi:MAG: nitrogen regulation protein NR(I) [Pseudomonadota bacterium]
MNIDALIIDDDASIRWVLEKALSKSGISCQAIDDGSLLFDKLQKMTPSVIISDIRMPQSDGLDILSKLQDDYPSIPVIIITAHSDLQSAVSAYQGGAFEYLPKPFDLEDAVATVKRALEFQETTHAQTEAETNPAPEIIGEAPAMQEVFRAIGRLSRSNITVLINGESGTGKELVAHALHRHSPRAQAPFIALNMAAIPRELMESELFGHEKGAFTGANQQHRGRFEQANSGTLFLDEIGDMPMETQTRLLRVLSDGEFFRVGGTQAVKVDVRVIAATHQNLESRVEQGQFREDLFHRLNVIRVALPALRQRKADIPLLAKHFLQKAADELNVDCKQLTEEVTKQLQSFDWPGNVRQLENTCRWLTVMASGRDIHVQDLPPELYKKRETTQQEFLDWESALRQWVMDELNQNSQPLLPQAQQKFERALLECALTVTSGHKQGAAKLIGWGRNTLTRKLKELYQ